MILCDILSNFGVDETTKILLLIHSEFCTGFLTELCLKFGRDSSLGLARSIIWYSSLSDIRGLVVAGASL